MLPQLNLQGHQPGLPRTPVYDAIAGYASGGEVVAPGGRSKYEYASQLQQTINDLRRIGTQDALAQAREIQRELLALMRPQEDATPPVPPPLDPNAPNDPQALEQRRTNSAPTPAPITVPADPAPLPGDMDLERVICPLYELGDPGAKGFTRGEGDWPLRGFVERMAELGI